MNMSNLSFISDVIYGLKIEYGEPMIVGTHNWTTNQQTGVKTDSPTTYMIGMVIPLPENLRESFFKSIGAKLEGRIQKGQRIFLLDKADVQSPMIEGRSWIEFDSKKYDVQTVDDYIHGLIVTCQAVTGGL